MRLIIKGNEILIDMEQDVLIHSGESPVFSTDSNHVVKLTREDSNIFNVELFFLPMIKKYLTRKKRNSRGQL